MLAITSLILLAGCSSRKETFDECKQSCFSKYGDKVEKVTLTGLDINCLCNLDDGRVMDGWKTEELDVFAEVISNEICISSIKCNGVKVETENPNDMCVPTTKDNVQSYVDNNCTILYLDNQGNTKTYSG